MYSLSDIESRVYEVFDELGMSLSGQHVPIESGKIVRFKVDGDKNGGKSGSFCVHCDDRPAGWVKNWRTNETTTFTMKELPELSAVESERLRQQVEAERVSRAEEMARKQEFVAKSAREKWKNAAPADENFPYLIKKQVPPFNLRHGKDEVRVKEDGSVTGGRTDVLYIPLYESAGQKLVNIQQIFANGKKFPLTGGEFKSVFSPIGKNPDGPILICEGWATGASLHLMTGYTVICAMNAGNMPSVTRMVRQTKPDREILICADNDHMTEQRTGKNPGKIAAFNAAEGAALGAPIWPDFSANEDFSDWNDYMVAHGTAQALEHFNRKRAEANVIEPVPENCLMNGALFPDINIKSGKPLGTIENVESLLRFYRIDVRYNEVTKSQEIFFPRERVGGDNKLEADTDRIISLAARHEIPTSRVASFVDVIANDNNYNPVRDWISSKKWDGIPRLTEFIRLVQVQDGFDISVADMMIRKWMVSAVAAAFEELNHETVPFSASGVLVLQGEQGCGKTTWFRNLAPKGSGWIGEGKTLDPTKKDSLLESLRVWIVELGEFESTLKKERAILKAFTTNTEDTIRLPYARKPSVFPRRTVFGASVNQYEFLSDDTGNRRWWCIPVKNIKWQHIMDMQQIWAEVFSLYSDGYSWHPSKAEEAIIERTSWKFMYADPVMDVVLQSFDWTDYPNGLEKGITATEVLRLCGMENPKTPEVRQCGVVLRKLTGTEPHRGHGGVRLYMVPSRDRDGKFLF